MNSIAYRFLSSYFNKYFKNVEHLDLSLKNSKIKINSIVPHAELFTNLFHLGKFNLKIESGLFRNLVLEFPFNFMKNPIKISCRSADFYITETETFIEKAIAEELIKKDGDGNGSGNGNAAFIEMASSPKSSGSGGNSGIVNGLNVQVEDSFWENIKDDIIANLIIQIESINVYLFTKQSIVKLELTSCRFSPSELPLFRSEEEEGFEFKETFIKDSNKQKSRYRKCLIFDQIKASLQESLTANTHLDKYFLKNVKVILCLDYFNTANPKETAMAKTVFIDNFLFDYDIFEFYRLHDLISGIIHGRRVNNAKDYISNQSCNQETIVQLNNANINFYYNNNEEILFYFVIERFIWKYSNSTFHDISDFSWDFDLSKVFLFIPLLDSHLISKTMNTLQKKPQCNNQFIKVCLKNKNFFNDKLSRFSYTGNTLNKNLSLNFKLTLGKEKKRILSEEISMNLIVKKSIDLNETNVTDVKISLNNLTLLLEIDVIPVLFASAINIKQLLSRNFKSNFQQEKRCLAIVKKGSAGLNSGNVMVTSKYCDKSIGNASCEYKFAIKIPTLAVEVGKFCEFAERTSFIILAALKLHKIRASLSLSSCIYFTLTSYLTLEVTNLLHQRCSNVLDNVQVTTQYSNNRFNFSLCNVKMNLDSYFLNIIDNARLAYHQNNPQIESSTTNSTLGASYLFFSKIKNCTSSVLELQFLNRSLSYFLKPNEEKEIVHKLFHLRYSINDSIFENEFDISQIFSSHFTDEVYSINNREEVGKEHIDYTHIELKEMKDNKSSSNGIVQEVARTKTFNLFYRLHKHRNSQIHLFIFDRIIVIHSFPSMQILSYIISKSSEISSVDKFYHDNYIQNLQLVAPCQNPFVKPESELIDFISQSKYSECSPILSFLCDNYMFRNFFSSEIEIEINYSDKTEVVTIPPREEKTAMIFCEKLDSLHVVVRFSNKYKHAGELPSIMYVSEDVKNAFGEIPRGMIFNYHNNSTFCSSVRLSQKVKSGILASSGINLNFSVEDFNRSSVMMRKGMSIVQSTALEMKSPMKLVKLLPNLVIRNLTSAENFSFYFVVNEFCDKIKSSPVELADGNLNMSMNGNSNQVFDEFTYDFMNNLYEVRKKESSFILNEHKDGNTAFSLTKIRFAIKINNIDLEQNQILTATSSSNVFYFSEKIQVSGDIKDYVAPILIAENLVYLFRVKLKTVNDGVISITLSSFLNFSISFNCSSSIESIILKNTAGNSLCENIILSMNYQEINRHTDINYDTLYQVTRPVTTVDVSDVFALLDLLKSIENSIEMHINNDYCAELNIKELFINENYQLCAVNQLNFLNKVKSKIYHVRMIHNPYFICELFDEFYNLSKNFYLFMSNASHVKCSVYLQLKNTPNTMDRIEMAHDWVYELVVPSSIDTLLVTVNGESDVYLIRYGEQFDAKNIGRQCSKLNAEHKATIDVKFENRVNCFFIEIAEISENQCECEAFDKTAQETVFNFSLSNVNLNLNIFPFFMDDSFLLHLTANKILGSCTTSYRLVNFSLTNCHVFTENSTTIFQSKFLTDIKLENQSNTLFPQINFKSVTINLPLHMELSIDDALFHYMKFFFLQLDDSKQISGMKYNYNPSNLKVLNTVILPDIESIYSFNEISINDFDINCNIEYRKGLNFVVKNSKIAHKHSKIKNLIGVSSQIFNEIKNNFMKNFFAHVYNLLKATELFGNMNQFFEDVKSGYTKFKERPFTSGIFSLVYASLKGGINSFIGIGRSITKSIRNFNVSNYSSQVYKKYTDALVNELMTGGNVNLVMFNFTQVMEYHMSKSQVNALVNKISCKSKQCDINISLNIEDTGNCSRFFIESQVTLPFNNLPDSNLIDTYCVNNSLLCKHKNEACIVMLTKYFFIICKNVIQQKNIQIEYLIPYADISTMTYGKNKIILTMKNNLIFELAFQDDRGEFGRLYFKHEILNKFE